jgi:hypothetical protein
MIEKLKIALARLNGPAPPHRRIEVSDTGVRLLSAKSGRVLWAVRWDSVEDIIAYKVDAVIVDHICIGLREHGETRVCVADEDTPGWSELNLTLEKRFGLVQASWFPGVAFPPFAENWTTLWTRPT